MLTLVAGYLHILVLLNAGALWRDEVSTVNLATLPSFVETWRMVMHHSNPILFPSLVRGWAALGFGRTDFELRILGFAIGLSVVAAVWLAGRLMHITWPVLSLALLATNLALVRWGDSLRPYGLGCVLLLLFVGLVWSFVNRPSRNRYLVAAIVGVLSAQSLSLIPFFLMATCGSGAVVCLRRKQRCEALATLCIGLPAALSLIPYASFSSETQSWVAILQHGFHPLAVWFSLFHALDLSAGGMYLVWLALFLLAAAVGCATLATRGPAASADMCDRPLFASLNLILGAVGIFVFHWIAKHEIYPWHWLPFMVFAAINMEAALTQWAQRFRTAWLILACIVSLVPLPATIRAAQCAHTNMDVLGAQVSKLAEPGDLIVVYPWESGISFARYYSGSVEWVTLPPVNDLRFHRYDLVRQDLDSGASIKPVFDRAEQVLASGHHVWMVGRLPDRRPLETELPVLPPPQAPNSQTEWYEGDYTYVWGRQMGDFLSKHAQNIWVPKMPAIHCLTGYEVVPILEIAGWRNPPSN